MNYKKIHHLEKSKRDQVIGEITALLSTEKKVVFAYLHGSFKQGLSFRDIDLAVFTTDNLPKKHLDYELMLEEKIEHKIKLPIDLKVLNNAPPTFCYMVIKKGQVLLVRDDSKRVDFEVSTLKQYFDILPFRQRYLKELING